jgi:hypothetical protein
LEYTHQQELTMSSANDEVLCPLCHGHGRGRKEVLVVRWRSREFERGLQELSDEAAFGKGGGLKVPFEMGEKVYSNESD